MKHHCNKNGWQHCAACRGRIHLDGCTTKRRPRIDCCEVRHRMLAAVGDASGLDDSSLPMYDEERPTWAK